MKLVVKKVIRGLLKIIVVYKEVEAYEQEKFLGCAVEGFSSSHHGGSHRTDNYVMHGAWTVLEPPPTPSIACHTPTFRWEKRRGLLKRPRIKRIKRINF